MTPFQYIVLPLLGLLAGRSVYRAIRFSARRKNALCSGLIWLAAAISILRPELPSFAAKLLGIGRGADLVFYSFCIGFIAFVIYVYHRLQQLDGCLTEVVRRLALRDARFPVHLAPPAEDGDHAPWQHAEGHRS